MNKKERVEKICGVCGDIFLSLTCKKQKFCSIECYREYRRGLGLSKRGRYESVKCKYCGEYFEVLICLHRQFCSNKCKANWQKYNLCGNNNPNWQGGKKPFSSRIKQTKRWKEWREAVFEQDVYTCQVCGQKGKWIEPHHLKSKQAYPELVFQVENGVALCKECHRRIHKIKPANQSVVVMEYPLSLIKNYAI